MSTIKLERIDDFRWRVPIGAVDGMRTDGIIFADDTLAALVKQDQTAKQVANVAALPGIVGHSMAMPDTHWGYGFPIGGVAGFDVDEGIISPGGVGYDINCGVRLLRTNLSLQDVTAKMDALLGAVFGTVPAGVGGKGQFRLSRGDLRRVLREGARWTASEGYGSAADLEHTEASGCMQGADDEALSDRALERGGPQLGTLGSGNHFLEVQIVERIEDQRTAEAFGIHSEGQVCVMIHCGSRGLGHQVCDDAIADMLKAAKKYEIDLPDRQLACAPVSSPEGQRYFAAMAAAANYAWANRQAITHQVREAFARVMKAGPAALGLELVYDVAHNVAKFETHDVGGRPRRLCVHRKGATRAFGPGHEELPPDYRPYGQPVLVPGDMGTGSHLLAGTEQAMIETWGSTAHGAGRVLSRTAAIKRQHSNEVRKRLEQQGILVMSVGKKTLAEEAPEAYKDVDAVVNVCHGAGISRRVARLRPVAVMKG